LNEFFASFNLLMLFLLIAGVGFLFLLVSLAVGDLFEYFEGAHSFDGAGDIAVLDSRVLSVFITAFGGFGAIGVQFGLGAIGSSLLGLGGGVIFGGLIAMFAKFLTDQQASSSVSANQLVGRTAQVTVTIKPDQIGQISVRFGEERIEKLARAKDGTEIKTGAIVRIESIAGDSVIVSAEENTNSFLPSKTV
jgi:membrane protein implicated in regulation of membrane protease activity